MNSILTKRKSRGVHPGTLIYGASRVSSDFVFTQLFRCRKGGIDYLGQIRINSKTCEVRLELFNDTYFDLFTVSPNEVLSSLKKKIFTVLSIKKSVPEGFREIVENQLGAMVEKDNGANPAHSKEMPEGKFDLYEIYNRLNTEYFNGGINARVEWSRNLRGRNRKSFRYGSYDENRKLIRIHPRLKQSFVPMYVLELTVYHEMCHQHLPSIRKNGMWIAHHKSFKEKERQYRFYREARDWEKKHWEKLLLPVSE